MIVAEAPVESCHRCNSVLLMTTFDCLTLCFIRVHSDRLAFASRNDSAKNNVIDAPRLPKADHIPTQDDSPYLSSGAPLPALANSWP